MSGKRVLAVYAALLLGFAVVLCRLYLLALHPAYAARAAAQSTVTLQLPARRGNFYDAQGRLLTGLEERWQVVCFPGQGNYDRLYACTDAAGHVVHDGLHALRAHPARPGQLCRRRFLLPARPAAGVQRTLVRRQRFLRVAPAVDNPALRCYIGLGRG